MKYIVLISFFLWNGYFQQIQAFDVKVLLQKYNLQSQELITLHSKTGFIISSDPELSIGHRYKHNNLEIAVGHAGVHVDQKLIQEKMIFVYPALTDIQIEKLNKYIDDWFDQNIQSLELDQVKTLQRFFDSIVKQGIIADSEYEVLVQSIVQIIDVFLKDFLETITSQVPVIGVDTLLKYVQELYRHNIKIRFLELLAQEKLSKEERKNIEKNVQARYEFFESKMYHVACMIMKDFLPIIPAKLLHQFLQDEEHTIQYNQCKYLGSMILLQEKKQLLLINNLDIDDYLISVVRHEGWPGWPLEMNKVLAIACRTYLVWQILQAQKLNRAYHIENGIKHQTYKGHHVNAKMKQAIQLTRDMFVAFDGKPALTMYDACCGGIIPAHIDDPGYKKISYLARTYPCTFCKNFKIFHWQQHFSEQQVIDRLKPEFGKINKVVDIAVIKRDRAGLVKKISINVAARKIVITEKKMKALFPEIKSMLFNITTHSGSHKKFEIAGKGYGHHKGLCQWGAYKLVKDDGWSVEQVLQFYYPGTTLMKLSYQR